jgi:hypothetical protein
MEINLAAAQGRPRQILLDLMPPWILWVHARICWVLAAAAAADADADADAEGAFCLPFSPLLPPLGSPPCLPFFLCTAVHFHNKANTYKRSGTVRWGV